MRIVAVTTWFPTERATSSGAFVEKDVAAIAARPGIDSVDVLHLVPPHQDDGSRAFTHNGIRVRRVPMSTRSPLDILTVARSLGVLLAGADVVHTMAFSSLLPFRMHRPDVPWVHTEHWSGLTTPATLPLAGRAALPLLKPLLRMPDVVTGVCEYLAAPIRAVRGDAATAVVPCIVPPREHLTPRPMRPRAPMRLVAVGGLVERKDPLLAVDTIAELARRGVTAELTWVGGGELHDQVVRRARKRKVGHLIRLAGTADSAGVSAALDAADLFFLPTRADNFCVSAAEALVHGRPVVVGATGGQGEYIRPEVGTLVDVQDAEAYADAIVETERRTRHLNASDVAGTIGDAFSAARVGAGYVAAYAAAAAGHRG
ncbi:glycosyltransferase [Occultella gossypii]|uniref:Glycosyltransferase n=1 Tax=Occultella gossypii TaxID=2800820 RepID=A0ABS7S7Y1_9MICO|nr:glycosyltransferase [Occultella gossypii]MBZ2196456.1 glycosyltransferase [Occultella gossypii]